MAHCKISINTNFIIMATTKEKTGTTGKKSTTTSKSAASKEMRNPNASKEQKSNAAKEMASGNHRGGKNTHH